MVVPDIEDLSGDVATERANKHNVVPSARVSKGRPATEQAGSDLPGAQTVFVRTWGCGHNTSDGEYMAGLLNAYGYTIVSDGADADVWVLNSCTVKNPSETSLQNEIARAKREGKKLVVAGCVPQADRSSYEGYSVVGTHQIDQIVGVVEETLKGHTVRLLKEKKEAGRKVGGAALSLPKIRRNALIEIISISTGCLNQCTYCKTKHARGELGSYHVDEICARVEQVLQEGVVEVWLTSEDTGAYGRDIGASLPMLLRRILPLMPPGTRLKVGMTNPPYILEHLEEMAELFSHPRLYKFLHVPVQAGSDRVLEVMKREYTAAEFRHVVEFLRERVPGITIATDIICGFPTETEDEFEQTLDLVRDYMFHVVNISQFYARPGTPAKRMVQVATNERKRRSRLLTELFYSYEPYAGREGHVYRVLVTDVSSDGRYWVAHNDSYEQILIEKDPRLWGREVDVTVVKQGKFFMVGEVVEGSLQPAVALHTNNKPPRQKQTQRMHRHGSRQLWRDVLWRVLLALLVVVAVRVWKRL